MLFGDFAFELPYCQSTSELQPMGGIFPSDDGDKGFSFGKRNAVLQKGALKFGDFR